MILRLPLALIYLYAGLTKVFDPVLFKATILSYFHIPDFVALALAISFPWIEIIAALSLIFKWKMVYSSGFLFFLSVFLFFIILLNYNNILPYGCGCFGLGDEEQVGVYHIVRDFLISILAGTVFFKALLTARAGQEHAA